MKKKIIMRVLTGLMVVLFMFAAVGCNTDSGVPSDPKDAIIDKYGNTQYKITFDATNLASPISDMYYSAENMPVLPTPEKVGYVFAGWYFDSALTKVCDVENGDLYWQMKNVTLYPKWEKEAIVNNGTYDIDFEAHIVEDSVVKGILADKYGWYNLAEDIVAAETYIEKNDQGAFLRIQYNSRVRGPIFADGGGGEFEVQTYTVTDNNGRISEGLSILDRTSLIQTIYYDISGLDLADEIVLNVAYYNWAAKLEDGETREQCSVSYKVSFNITRFIGFSKSFINTDGELYSAATNFLTLIDAAATNFTVEKTDIGKTVDAGDTVDLIALYTELVYPTVTAANLSWQAYSLDSSGDVDYNRPVGLSRNFTMTDSGVAVLYTERLNGSTRTCLVTVMPSEEPVYTLHPDEYPWAQNDEGVYVTSKRFKIGDYVSVPEVTWTWLGDKFSSRNLKKYDDDEPRTDFLCVGVYSYSDGVYVHTYSQFSDGYSQTNVFQMTDPKMRVEFRLVNRFGEFRSVWLEYRAEAVGDYAFSLNGETLGGGDLKYEKTEDGTDVVRSKVAYTELQSAVIDNEQQFLALPVAYSLRVTDSDVTKGYDLTLTSINVFTKDDTATAYTLEGAWNIVKGKPYAVVVLSYADEYGDTVELRAMCNFTIDGRDLSAYTFVDGEASLFTGEPLSIEKPKLASGEYMPLTRPFFHVYKLSGLNYNRTEDSDMTDKSGTYSAEFTFNQAGTYLLVWDFWFGLDFDGNAIMDCYYNPPFETNNGTYQIEATFAQKVVVYDRNCDIEVTYVTDAEHPFNPDKVDYVQRDGYQYYTTTVSMAESNKSPDYTMFASNDDRLWGWSSSWDGDDRLFSAGAAIGRLGITLKTVKPVVYALWDKGINVSATVVYDDGKEEALGDTKTYWRPTTGGIYTVSLFDFHGDFEFDKFKDYQAVEWQANKKIFQLSVGTGYVYSNVLEVASTEEAFRSGYRVTEGFTLKLILKRKLNVSYQAIDEEGTQLTFVNQPGADKNCLEGFTVASRVSEVKLNMLNNVQCTDSAKEFKYWAVMSDGVLTRIDIENTPLEQKFSTKNEQTGKYNGSVVLYAVFGARGNA